jgi:anti-sigma-K factor RskA
MAEPDALIAMGGQGRGAVVRGSDGAIVMAVSLPQLQAGRVYQLWFIQGQGAPIPSETFRVDAQGRALVTLSAPQAASADTFAVTEEPDGGSQAPTTRPVLAGSIAPTEG